MVRLVVLLLFFTQMAWGSVPFWSKTGHRVIGEVAQEQLSRKAQRAIKELLDGQSLAAVANYADEIKADPAFSSFGPWHYVNFPADKRYGEETPSAQGDLIVGIQKCVEILRDSNSSDADKAFYLKMLVHLVGDLHQPMHVGRLEDKGGNDIQVRWFGEGTNLHRLWDANLINSYGMSYSELTDALPKLDKEECKLIQQGGILDWVEESQELANELYGSVSKGEKLGYQYSYKYMDTVRMQLLKGGLRLGQMLNDIFS